MRGEITWKQTNRIALLDFYPVTVMLAIMSGCLCLSVKTTRLKDLNVNRHKEILVALPAA